MIRYWKLPGPGDRPDVVLTSVLGPRELVELALARDGNGVCANKAVLGSATAPVGATHWRDSVNDPWRPIEEYRA